jgi:uncharacterized protein (DUF433 family)
MGQSQAQGTPQTQWKYLRRKPKSNYLQLYVEGRVAARTIYGQHVNAEEPRTVEELARDFGFPLEAIQEAIAYCRSNPPEIDIDFQREEALMEASGMNDPGYKWDPKGKYKVLSPEERARITQRFKAS